MLSVGGVLSLLARHPVENILRRWNWKSAILSAVVRGSLFFTTNLGSGLNSAIEAMLIESAFYVTIAGFYGALIESFRRARPAWAASLTVMFLLPLINHSLEFTLHYLSGTDNVARSVIASICLSMVSALFNLHAMRRGVLIVGNGRSSLLEDIIRMPRILLEFTLIIPRSIWRRLSIMFISSR